MRFTMDLIRSYFTNSDHFVQLLRHTEHVIWARAAPFVLAAYRDLSAALILSFLTAAVITLLYAFASHVLHTILNQVNSQPQGSKNVSSAAARKRPHGSPKAQSIARRIVIEEVDSQGEDEEAVSPSLDSQPDSPIAVPNKSRLPAKKTVKAKAKPKARKTK